MRWLMRWWRAYQRRIDLEILWPTCKRQAQEAVRGEDWHGHDPLELAKAAFAMHAYHDPAWLTLGDDAIFAAIEELR